MLGRHLAVYLVPNAAQALASFGTVAILTRLLSEAEYGRYALVFAAMSLGHYLLLTWAEAAAARFYPEAEAKGEKPAHFATLLSAYAWSALAFAVVSACVVAFYPADAGLKLALAAAFGGAIARSGVKIALESRRMALEARRAAGLDTLHTLLGFALGVACVAFLAMGEEGPFIGMAIAAVVVLAIEGPALWAAARGGRTEPARVRDYMAFGLPLSLGLIMTLALTSGDRFMIAAYLGEAEVGAYAAGYQVAARILDIIFVWGASAAYPLLVSAWETGGREAAREAARAGYAVRLGLAAPAAVGIALVAVPLCDILIGEALREQAAMIAPWIALAGLLAGMCDYFSDAFLLAKKAMQRALLMLVPVVLNLGLNALLLPVMGLMGAVVATVLAYAAGIVLLALAGRRYVALPVPVGITVRIALACLVMAGVVSLVPAWGGLPELAVKAALGAVAYGLSALILDIADTRTRLQHLAQRLKARRTGASS